MDTRAVEVSVVIACRNEGRHLGAMLDSLAQQSWNGPWEVIVADNGSTDNSRDVALAYKAVLPLTVIDASERRGSGHARNVGVRESAGPKILFVDGDDQVNTGYVAAMAAALDDHELVAGQLDLYKLNPPSLLEVWPALDQQGGPLVVEYGVLPFAGGCATGIRRTVFEEIGGNQPEAFLQDVDLSWRVQLAGHAAPVSVPGAIVHYRLPSSALGHYRRRRNYKLGEMSLYASYRRHGMNTPTRPSVRDVLGSVRRIRSKDHLMLSAGVIGSFVGGIRGPSQSVRRVSWR
jgi:glycosyltransferase involved in cell wall biosynthesis